MPFRLLACAAFAIAVVTPQAMAAHSHKAKPHATPSAGAGEPPRLAGMVAAHNRARTAVGVGDLAWSADLAATAQKWADHLRSESCAMHHSGAPGVGENLAWAAGQHLTAATVVGMWVAEKRAFDPATGGCASGAVCGHYTQVVWRSTTHVGCGMASCGNAEIWVCNYAPPGNYIGDRPY